MEINAGGLALVILLMFVMATLFVMRRRARQGRRRPTF